MSFTINKSSQSKSSAKSQSQAKSHPFGQLATTARRLAGTNGVSAAISAGKPQFGANRNSGMNAQITLKNFLG